jgi:type IV pilus assembly protein PilP
MNRALLIAGCAALLAAACGNRRLRRARGPGRRGAPKPVTDEGKSGARCRPPSTSTRRSASDPFQNQSVTQQGFGRAASNTGRVKSPLEKSPLDQLKLSLTVTGTATPMAMVEDTEKRGWPVRLGDFIGQNGGKVTGIHRDEIVVTETITDHSTGRVYPQNVKLAVPVSREEEKDFKALQEGERLGVARGEQ